MPSSTSAKLALLTALASCGSQLSVGQNATPPPIPVEQRIQHVTSGLIGGIVLSGQSEFLTFEPIAERFWGFLRVFQA